MTSSYWKRLKGRVAWNGTSFSEDAVEDNLFFESVFFWDRFRVQLRFRLVNGGIESSTSSI